jgi:hypothetical protein
MLFLVAAPSAALSQTSSVSFNKDVLPILQKNCQVCHRTGEVAPMSFETYASTRPWAKAIKQAVLKKQMPPWFADIRYGDFRNQPQLTDSDIQTLTAWADSGAPEGEAKAKPAPIAWPTGWRVKPDVILSMPETHNVPAKGAGEIKTFVVPNPFKEDTWVSSIEIRPSEPSVVHHVMLQVQEPGQATSWGAPPAACVAGIHEAFLESPVVLGGNPNAQAAKPKDFVILEAVYVPGNSFSDFRYYNSAKLIKGGGNLRLQVHYTPNGKAVSDQTKIGFVLAQEPPQRKFVMLAPKSIADPKKRIPAGDGNFETRGVLEFAEDAQLVSFMPHMHLRGKDMTYTLESPDGRRTTVLRANFNFDWQLAYELETPIRVRRGTRLEVVAHHDNSANNAFNPDSSREVAWGNLTSEEMVLPWFGVLVDNKANPERILAVRQTGCNAPGSIIPAFPAKAPNLPFGLPFPAPAGKKE